MDRKKKIELILGSVCIIPVLIGKLTNNNLLMTIGGIPLFAYLIILAFDIFAVIDFKPVSVQGRISNIAVRHHKLIWKDFDLILESGKIKKFSIPAIEFPKNIIENDWIEVSYKKTSLIGYTYVTEMKQLKI